MSMLSLERRRSNPRAIYAACMVGLSIGVPVLIVLPKVVEIHAASAPQIGAGCQYNGAEYTITGIRNGTVTLFSNATKSETTAPQSEITVDDRWIADEYKWASWFLR